MAKVASFLSLAGLTLDRNAKSALHRQLYLALQQDILQGRLRPGTRLPPTRDLAKELGVSRNTITKAYELLWDEGYLESKIGSGTRVNATLPESMLNIEEGQQFDVEASVQGEELLEPPLSHQVHHLQESYSEQALQTYVQPQGGARAFSPTLPAVDLFPKKLWEKLLLAAWRSLNHSDLGYQSPQGYRPLREALANYMQRARGVRCRPEQIIITSGTQQALSMICQVLLNPCDSVWLEDPSFPGIQVALGAAQARSVPVAVDDEGFVLEAALRHDSKAKMVYISPSHQYPTGVTMSLRRRLELLQWAQDEGAWIVEDDYDSEFRYSGPPLAALQGLDMAGRVIYIGTFSKVLFPALRIAYMVVPESLVGVMGTARASVDRCQSVLEQVVLSNFISEGHFARHIRRMRTIYAERQSYFVALAQRELGEWLDVQEKSCGLHLACTFKVDVDDEEVARVLRTAGIEAPALSSFSRGNFQGSGLVIGYAAVAKDETAYALNTMREVLRRGYPSC